MRVRIRRFGRLRLLSKAGDSDALVVAGVESGMDRAGGAVPPAAVDRRGLRRERVGQSESAHLRVDLGAALPLFELQRPQPVADPFVIVSEGLRRVRQLEVCLPSGQILLQFRDHGFKAPSAAASGYLPYALLQRAGRFWERPGT